MVGAAAVVVVVFFLLHTLVLFSGYKSQKETIVCVERDRDLQMNQRQQ